MECCACLGASGVLNVYPKPTLLGVQAYLPLKTKMFLGTKLGLTLLGHIWGIQSELASYMLSTQEAKWDWEAACAASEWEKDTWMGNLAMEHCKCLG